MTLKSWQNLVISIFSFLSMFKCFKLYCDRLNVKLTTFWANTINIIKTFKNTVVKEKFCNMYISQSAANNIFIIIEHNACHIQQRVNYFYTLVRVIGGSISCDVIGQFLSFLNPCWFYLQICSIQTPNNRKKTWTTMYYVDRNARSSRSSWNLF